MDIKLHANARTTPAVRAYIQRSPKSGLALARELGVSVQTVYKWRKAGRVHDGSHARHNLGQSTSPLHEGIIVELRNRLRLSLDDLVEVMNRGDLGRTFSRSAIHRCLVRLGVNRLPKRAPARSVGKFEEARCGLIHIDLKTLACLGKRRSYAFVAIDRATRFVFVRVIPRRDRHTVRRCLDAFIAEFPHPVHTLITDHDGAFTDRVAVHKEGKPKGRPGGAHPFDAVCRRHRIKHRLIRPFRPKTNGMVERFNPPVRAGAGKKFASHPQRDAFIHRFVANYNRTRLKCLGYKAPVEVLDNPAGQYTLAST